MSVQAKPRRFTSRLPGVLRGRRLVLVAATTVLSIVWITTYLTSLTRPETRTRSATTAYVSLETNNYIHSEQWETPFSFSVSSANADIAVLPPLEERCRVYTFFDPSLAAAAGRNVSVEERIIEVWRQAFWALGFKPTVLDLADAKQHKLYAGIEGLNLEAEVATEAIKYLAWATQPLGLYTSYRLLPMTTTPTENTFKFLRSCQYGPLMTYKDIGNALVVGSPEAVQEFVETSFSVPHKGKATAAAATTFSVEEATGFFAHYSPKFCAKNYAALPADELPDLMNAHLHSTWLSRFPDGISVVDPFPETTHAIVFPSLGTANALATCPPIEYEDFCPPNIKDCYKCSKQRITPFVRTDTKIPDSASTFVFITALHPMTMLALSYGTPDITADVVRRKTARDMFTRSVTSEIIKEEVGAPHRALELKRIAVKNSEVLDAEYISVFEAQFEFSNCMLHDYFRWAIGFNFAPTISEEDKMTDNIPLSPKPEIVSFDALALEVGGCLSSSEYIELQKESERVPESKDGLKSQPLRIADVLTIIRDRISSPLPARKKSRKMIEAWNMADAEVWRFVKALNERTYKEEQVWE